MRLGAVLVALYLIVAAFLGLRYSWSWAAFVVFAGLIPFGAIWSAGKRLDESHLDWNQQERDRQHR